MWFRNPALMLLLAAFALLTVTSIGLGMEYVISLGQAKLNVHRLFSLEAALAMAKSGFILYVVLAYAASYNSIAIMDRMTNKWYLWSGYIVLACVMQVLDFDRGSLARPDIAIDVYGWLVLVIVLFSRMWYVFWDCYLNQRDKQGNRFKLKDMFIVRRTDNRLWACYALQYDYSISINFMRKWIALELNIGDEGEATLFAALFFVDVHITVPNPYWAPTVSVPRTTGFSLSPEYCSISFLKDQVGMADYYKIFEGWSKGISTETLLKGSYTYKQGEEIYAGPQWLMTKPRVGYDTEKLHLKVYYHEFRIEYSRWFDGPSGKRWSVRTVDENVARVPGKGENGWDQDDNFGIDITFGPDPSIYSAKQAALAAIESLDQQRARRY